MSGSFGSDDEIRAELDRTRADIEQTRADIEHTRAELAETVQALSAEISESRHSASDGGYSSRGAAELTVQGPRAIAKIAQAARPVVVRAAGDTRRDALFAASALWLLAVLRRRHRR
jgi:hypothetical protein